MNGVNTMKTKFLYLNETQLEFLEQMTLREIGSVNMQDDTEIDDLIELVDLLKAIREQRAKS